MEVLVYSAKDFEIPYLEEANSKRHKLTFLSESLSSETVMNSVGYDAVSIFSADDGSAIILEKLKEFGVKYLALRCTGHDNVNLKVAARLGIKVANVPDYSPYAIAEHAVSLLLGLNRRLIESNKRVRSFNFDINGLIGFDLNNKTVGILGTGKIGSVMAKIMYGFGCKLFGYDLVQNKTLKEKYGMAYTSLEDICRQADIISIHLPLNSETHYLINKNIVDIMKPGIVIINTARGAILDTKSVLVGLESGVIGALGLDVYEHEKKLFFKDMSQAIPFEDINIIKLNIMPNVLITGHHAFLTEEALAKITEITIYNLNCWESGKENTNDLV
ncbi:D-lactate dehydrogenase [Mariniflexile rhizosphaerae]|uniref:2-hydroxyacid dehydrogenase n=1 Tax=unclassified Mariniflexile TaxID=2643887 RepID=UPI000CC64C2B|nr:2-hydroxyacid dehydrogenase [Mariniflexile sp. TRM1-10]AXP82240.1 D-lactate dehydrogenase [Mariniflexile sp. TRM1-10]PLB19194.1 MAG: D-lactate dehydrogenase [Flavobacteriaceae bacterium FS1-H7996/R]